jgi:hypothetical protein
MAVNIFMIRASASVVGRKVLLRNPTKFWNLSVFEARKIKSGPQNGQSCSHTRHTDLTVAIINNGAYEGT